MFDDRDPSRGESTKQHILVNSMIFSFGLNPVTGRALEDLMNASCKPESLFFDSAGGGKEDAYHALINHA